MNVLSPKSLAVAALLFAGLAAGDGLAQIAPAQTVAVAELAAPDPNALGILGPSAGGLGADMWSGSSMAVVSKVLPMLPAPTTWHSLLGLERRLLLSSASVPAGETAGQPLLLLRANRLWALGEIDGLNQLLGSVPQSAWTADLRHLHADVALVVNDIATACAEGAALQTINSNDVYATQLLAFCQISAGKVNEAGLTLDLLRDQKLADPTFFALADAMRGIGVTKQAMPGPFTALSLAMLRTTKTPLPDTAAATPAPALWRVIATLPNASLDTRLLVAEKGEAAGAVGVDVLRDTYEQVPATPDQLAAIALPGAGAKDARGTPRGRALMYRAVEQIFDPLAKATIIARALTQVEGLPAYFTVARLYARELVTLPQDSELAWFAYTAARALFAAGETETAQSWLNVSQNSAAATDHPYVLWPLQHLADASDALRPTPSMLDDWRQAPANAPTDAAGRRRTAVLLGLLTAAGDKVPVETWWSLTDGPPVLAAKMAAPALRVELRQAADAKRRGETALLTLIELADLRDIDPLELSTALAGLRAVGLAADARAIAVESAIANGL
jgi:hypothetical protein